MQMTDDSLMLSNPKIVDIEWRSLYGLASKNLNKILEPRFEITLTLLCQGDFKGFGGASETVESSGKRNQLRIQRVRFECDYQELTHMNFKVKNACNSLEQMVKTSKMDK